MTKFNQDAYVDFMVSALSAHHGQKARCSTWRCMTTDNGSDINFTRDSIKRLLGDTDPFFDLDCFSHQYSLMCSSLLWSMEEYIGPCFDFEALDTYAFRYYSTLATFMHTLRDNQADLFGVVTSKFRASLTHTIGLHRVAPRPIGKEWGRCAMCEDYLLRLTAPQAAAAWGLSEFAAIFRSVVSGKAYFSEGANNNK